MPPIEASSSIAAVGELERDAARRANARAWLRCSASDEPRRWWLPLHFPCHLVGIICVALLVCVAHPLPTRRGSSADRDLWLRELAGGAQDLYGIAPVAFGSTQGQQELVVAV